MCQMQYIQDVKYSKLCKPRRLKTNYAEYNFETNHKTGIVRAKPNLVLRDIPNVSKLTLNV